MTGLHWTAAGLVTALLLVPACGDDDGGDDTASSAESSDASTGGTGTSATTDSMSSTSVSGTDSATGESSAGTHATHTTDGTGTTDTGGVACGALTCGDGEYCDWIVNSCGIAKYDEPQCTPIPDGCPAVEEDPVCGCDGQIHGGLCPAATMGVDVDANGGCTAPKGTFACGYKYCNPTTSYCQWSVSDVLPSPDGYSCVPLPGACGDTPSCACLAGEPCADFGCEDTPDGGLLVTCPGG